MCQFLVSCSKKILIQYCGKKLLNQSNTEDLTAEKLSKSNYE